MASSSPADAGDKKGDETSVFEFLAHVSKLKHLERTGWVKSGIAKPETVASHMYRMAIMSGFCISDPTIDTNRCMKISLIHDIGESIIGDLTPHCGVSEEDKRKLEEAAVDKISQLLPDKVKGDEVRQLFQEYENGTTPEGRLVKDLDKFDMVLQAYEYERTENRRFLNEFFVSTEEYFARSTCHPRVKELVTQLYEARQKNVPFTM